MCSRSLLLFARVRQDKSDVRGQPFYPDAHRAMAYKEVDVGDAVKVTLMSFTTAKKLSLELVISGTLLKARRTCLYCSDCQEVAYDARQKT